MSFFWEFIKILGFIIIWDLISNYIDVEKFEVQNILTLEFLLKTLIIFSIYTLIRIIQKKTN